MSRSRKKNPVLKATSQFAKRTANRKVRRAEGIYNGGSYKRLYEPWSICDRAIRWTWQDELKMFYDWVSRGWRNPAEIHEKDFKYKEYERDYVRK